MYKLDIEQIRTICNNDGYIYVYYLRMCSVFFAILSLLNISCLVIYIFMDTESNQKLGSLQKLTILSMFGSKTKIL